MKSECSCCRRSRLSAVLVICAIALLFRSPGSADAKGSPRTKPGPVTIRGVATAVGPHRLVLTTTHRGTYSVILAANTTIAEKGHSGGLQLVPGEHVGVHGFLHGRSITAISVRIYPTKPKPRTVTGELVAVHASSLDVQSGSSKLRIYVTSGTAIRLGNSSTSLSRLPVGDRVDVRVVAVNGKTTAVSIHALKPKVAVRHVTFRGSLTGISSGSISVKAGGKLLSLGITSATAVHYGSGIVSRSSLRVGENVTVYAYQSGSELVATSIHIHKSASAARSVALSGQIESVSTKGLLLTTSKGRIEIRFSTSTSFQIGSHPAKESDLRVGDRVSIRAQTGGGRYVASRVHVYASSRTLKGVTGTLAAVGPDTIIVVASSGKRYQISLASKVPILLDSKPVSAARLQGGDHVRVKVRVDALGRLTAVTILAKSPVLKLTTVRGTLVSVGSRRMLIRADDGTRLQVSYPTSVTPLLRGKRAPSDALFPGVKVTVRGARKGSFISATSIRLTVSSRKDSGRITRLKNSGFVLTGKTGPELNVDVPAAVAIHDGAKRISIHALHVGTYVSITAYQEPGSGMRATSIHVDHPTLNLTAVVDSTNPFRIHTTKGVPYDLHLTANSTIEVVRYHLPLAPSDIPTGASVRVEGTVATDGSLAVSTMTVHLQSQTLRGRLTSIATGRMSLQVGDAVYNLRPAPGMLLLQSSLTLSLTDLVVGDDVTAYGLTLSKSVLLTRKMLVHRRRLTIDGTVSSISSTGFVIQSSDGPHQVLVSPSTSSTSLSSVQVGMLAHVTGYLRGDGAIVAVKVKLTKQKA